MTTDMRWPWNRGQMAPAALRIDPAEQQRTEVALARWRRAAERMRDALEAVDHDVLDAGDEEGHPNDGA